MMGVQEQAILDENAAALGVPQKQLMESSGNAVARVVRDVADPDSEVAVVAGRGNNGGDAFVTARFLTDYDVTVHLLGRPETITTDIARENWEALQRAEVDAREARDSTDLDLADPDVVVDAMLGTGVTGALREPEATAAERIAETDATVVAVDVPSGIDADTGEAAGVAVDADHVVTFHDQKPGLTELDADVRVADIGIPEAAELFVERGDLLRLSRDPSSHKGDHGEVLVIGGGPYTGAPALSARAAFRTGADLVRVACPSSVAREVQGFSEGIIVRPFTGDLLEPDHVDQLLDRAVEHDVVVIGPGLGNAKGTLEAVAEFLDEFDGRAVVDADALQVVPEVDTDASLLCTPHQGELRKMGGETDDDWERRADLVAEFAADVDQTLLVKGAYDVISDGEVTRVNRTGNPGMTVGGTGDVLAGASGALLATQEPIHAGAIAAYANGRAGDLAVEEYGHGLVAPDLVDSLPTALWGESDA
ncbi:bifunctional ADP-dependent (S)-NAD(P)H-hydrate dehydratase/NAD(P)H-hydrate epimerase [Halorientalis sp. IM1011]|uniref:bifunctional ADP-dependent NAD(P)H-hydrate dehydratase/NAD(P)H-hydrate epimerase n=1 Tax=Halorientalis sp. IM1011 TaxID=1932360 RepID=UPI00097CD3C1|nr:bifunctional ADP-dependent NAD(P)H-hydrate dehydratase/NAD(P)H-hydrate epimerase [Halorientalis sp. IM1011]AQL44191.1 bifunctional ADP-dependent (S)-NAD(P)H-hydrate dehydratase/NAD(P)H-hydrate epimerase [Halorientalis sp. IM1011]